MDLAALIDDVNSPHCETRHLAESSIVSFRENSTGDFCRALFAIANGDDAAVPPVRRQMALLVLGTTFPSHSPEGAAARWSLMAAADQEAVKVAVLGLLNGLYPRKEEANTYTARRVEQLVIRAAVGIAVTSLSAPGGWPEFFPLLTSAVEAAVGPSSELPQHASIPNAMAAMNVLEGVCEAAAAVACAASDTTSGHSEKGGLCTRGRREGMPRSNAIAFRGRRTGGLAATAEAAIGAVLDVSSRVLARCVEPYEACDASASSLFREEKGSLVAAASLRLLLAALPLAPPSLVCLNDGVGASVAASCIALVASPPFAAPLWLPKMLTCMHVEASSDAAECGVSVPLKRRRVGDGRGGVHVRVATASEKEEEEADDSPLFEVKALAYECLALLVDAHNGTSASYAATQEALQVLPDDIDDSRPVHVDTQPPSHHLRQRSAGLLDGLSSPIASIAARTAAASAFAPFATYATGTPCGGTAPPEVLDDGGADEDDDACDVFSASAYDTFNGTAKERALLAEISFWITIADADADAKAGDNRLSLVPAALASNSAVGVGTYTASEAHAFGTLGQSDAHRLASICAPHASLLLSAALVCLQQQRGVSEYEDEDEAAGSDEWSVAAAGAILLAALTSALGLDAVASPISEWALATARSGVPVGGWRGREAALTAIGCLLLGAQQSGAAEEGRNSRSAIDSSVVEQTAETIVKLVMPFIVGAVADDCLQVKRAALWAVSVAAAAGPAALLTSLRDDSSGYSAATDASCPALPDTDSKTPSVDANSPLALLLGASGPIVPLLTDGDRPRLAAASASAVQSICEAVRLCCEHSTAVPLCGDATASRLDAAVTSSSLLSPFVHHIAEALMRRVSCEIKDSSAAAWAARVAAAEALAALFAAAPSLVVVGESPMVLAVSRVARQMAASLRRGAPHACVDVGEAAAATDTAGGGVANKCDDAVSQETGCEDDPEDLFPVVVALCGALAAVFRQHEEEKEEGTFAACAATACGLIADLACTGLALQSEAAASLLASGWVGAFIERAGSSADRSLADAAIAAKRAIDALLTDATA